VITASVEGVEDGNSVTCKVHVVPSQGGSSEIILIQEKLNLETGETATLKWSTKPEGALVTWKSSNDSVATVANGVITAKGKGTATITASLEDGTSVTCTVTVKDPKKQIILQNAKVSLQPGQTWTPQYTTNPPNAEVRWSVENAEIATVNETTGEITAVAAGTTTVMGTIDGGDPVTITVTVNGQQKPFIILAEEELNLSVGDRYQLTYEVSSEDVEVEWKSSDETKATVDSNGQIEAKAEGGFYFCCDGSGDCFPWIPLFLLSHTLHGSGCEYFTWHQGFYGGAVCEYADWRGADDFNVNRSCFEKSGFSVQGNR
jgi:uncharacterized protein YjdB